MQKSAGEEALVHVDGEQGEDDDAQAVLEDGDGQDGEHQDKFGPGAPQEEVGGQDAGDHHGHGGADAAALFGHLDGDLAHLEDEALLIVRGADQVEDQGRGPDGAHLEQIDKGIHQVRGEGDQKEQEQQREKGFLEGPGPEEEQEGPQPGHQQGGDPPGHPVDEIRTCPLCQGGPIAYNAERDDRQPPGQGIGRRRPDLVPADIEQVGADQGDQVDMGIVLIVHPPGLRKQQVLQRKEEQQTDDGRDRNK